MTVSLFDPTGNITLLIEGECSRDEAAGFLQMHPEVEQAGFISETVSGSPDAFLEMAGGEFCGNASMCTGAWLALKRGLTDVTAHLKVSGAEEIVEVRAVKTGTDSFRGEVRMPRILEITEPCLSAEGVESSVPLVKEQGIMHLIMEKDSPFFFLLNEKEKAETAVKEWCGQLSAPGLGIMFVEGADLEYRMTPLVYVPASKTLFWEHSCASGSSAFCAYMAAKSGENLNLRLSQPGGTLEVKSDPQGRDIRLSGSIRLISRN